MKKFIQSFSFAINGIRKALAGQRNMRIHVGIALLVMAAGVYVDLSALDWCFVTFAMGLVVSTELMNTAVESLVDMIEPRQHPLAGKIKDIAAGAVLVVAVAAAAIGCFVFYKYMPW